MRDSDGNVEVVETVEEFIDKFEQNDWEFNYILDEEIELLMSWLRDYIKVKPPTIQINISPELYAYQEKLYKLAALTGDLEAYYIEETTSPTLIELYEKLRR